MLTTDNCQLTKVRIVGFKHRGLRRLYENDERRGLNPEHDEKIRRVLAMLDQTTRPHDLGLPGYMPHPLKGDMAGYWSVTIRANWRVVFNFRGQDVTDVDYLDYH